MIIHLLLNSLIVFLGLSLTIEFFLFILRIKNSRIRYICRILPYLKIPFDLLIFIFYGDSLFINLNPFSCEVNTYQFITTLFPTYFSPLNNPEAHVILPQYISSLLPTFWLNGLTALIIILAVLGILSKLYQLSSSLKFKSCLLKNSTHYQHKIENKCLQQDLDRDANKPNYLVPVLMKAT